MAEANGNGQQLVAISPLTAGVTTVTTTVSAKPPPSPLIIQLSPNPVIPQRPVLPKIKPLTPTRPQPAVSVPAIAAPIVAVPKPVVPAYKPIVPAYKPIVPLKPVPLKSSAERNAPFLTTPSLPVASIQDNQPQSEQDVATASTLDILLGKVIQEANTIINEVDAFYEAMDYEEKEMAKAELEINALVVSFLGELQEDE